MARGQGMQSPFSKDWIETFVAPLAKRAGAGEDRNVLADELYHLLHPFLEQYASRKARGLPPTADRCELHSRVMEAALLVCRNLDFDRYESFGHLLRIRLRGATIEAARHDDWLSRRHRTMLVHFRRHVEQIEQVEGRTLSQRETEQVAHQVAPEGLHVKWAQELTRQYAPTAWNEIYENTLQDHTGTPEDSVVHAERVRIVGNWLASLPEDLRNQAVAWANASLEHNRGAPRPLSRRLRPYVPDLMARLGNEAA